MILQQLLLALAAQMGLEQNWDFQTATTGKVKVISTKTKSTPINIMWNHKPLLSSQTSEKTVIFFEPKNQNILLLLFCYHQFFCKIKQTSTYPEKKKKLKRVTHRLLRIIDQYHYCWWFPKIWAMCLSKPWFFFWTYNHSKSICIGKKKIIHTSNGYLS